MTDVAADALITLDEYKDWLGEGKGDDKFPDSQVSRFINAASAYVVKRMDREVIAGTVAEIFDGDGTNSTIVKNRPLNDVTKIEQWDGTDWDELAAADYPTSFFADKGTVWFTSGDKFADGLRNYRITYTYGWAQALIPGDIKEACFLWVQMAKTRGKKGTVSSESLGDTTTTFRWRDVETDIMQLIEPYRRITLG